MTFFQTPIQRLADIKYKSASHTFNKAVIAAYNNVDRYGFYFMEKSLIIKQAQRDLIFCLKSFPFMKEVINPKTIIFSEDPNFSKSKITEICYNLNDLFANLTTSAIARGIKFSSRPQVKVFDYPAVDGNLNLIFEGWKDTKENDGKTYRISFNPARYRRSYYLSQAGFNIYQKLILIHDRPYALINFALDNNSAYELSFLSLFKNQTLRLINDQNDCIMINCLYDLYCNHKIKNVNLGTAAGIKGLGQFKCKLPHYETYVYYKKI